MRDFFEHQHRARRKTLHLVVLFALAVAVIVALAYGVVALAYVALSGYQQGQSATGPGQIALPSLWQPRLLVVIAPAVMLLVGGASFFRLAQLRGGGAVVASSLGGRQIDTETTDPDERKVLNVVEEMAIASGVPVPPVYLIEHEHGINAFAAGYRPEDAVIGVTRGCIQQLNRDELQGVIAHEFSHVFNGDMRLNLRLVGILFGILAIGMLGQMVFRGMLYGAAGSSRSSGNRRGGGGAAILIIIAAGVALVAIGYVGVFVGNLIKAAISRQREYLADASAVQFTRNPAGIAGALKKIGGLSFGARVRAAGADEFSHMFFGEAVAHHMGAMGATHPPLPDRIARIDPSWDGTFPEVKPPAEVVEEARRKQRRLSRGPAAAGVAGLAGGMGAGGAGGAGTATGQGQSYAPAESAQPVAAAATMPKSVRAAINDVGNPSPEHVELARELLTGLPDALRGAAREPYSARAVVYALLIDDGEQIAEQQFTALKDAEPDGRLGDLTRSLTPAARQLDERARLPLIDLAIASLRRLSPTQYKQFNADITALIRADEKISMFEWMLSRVLTRHLGPAFEKKPRRESPKYYSLKPLMDDLAVVVSALARAGARDEAQAAAAVTHAGGAARLMQPMHLLPRERCKLGDVDAALKRLDELEVAVKRRVIMACAACIAADHEITPREGELMRAVADSIGVPMPPLLPGQALV